MAYLTYSKDFQESIIKRKMCGNRVKDICKEFNISVYTLYKILHFNDKPPIPSQATEGKGSVEGVEHRYPNPNSNDTHERPASTWSYGSDRHNKVPHFCIRCGAQFYARDRGDRTKFCSKDCKNSFRKEQNSSALNCDCCGEVFVVKNSMVRCYTHCEKCRGMNLGRQSSKLHRKIFKWLKEEFVVEDEKTFDWFFDPEKPKGRFRMDFYIPKHKLCVEFDGEQHFRPSFTGKWESVDKIRKRDAFKEKQLISHGINTIRFRYDEPLTKKQVLMKIYAELQRKESVETQDKKLVC